MMLFNKQGGINSLTFELENDFREYPALSVVTVILSDDFIRLKSNDSVHRYRINYKQVSGIYKDNRRLYITYNTKIGTINTLNLLYDDAQKIDRFANELNRLIAIRHSEGITV